MATHFATLLLTRPEGMNAKVLASLDPISPGIQVIQSALMEICATGITADLSNAAGVIFTSRNGVHFGGPSQRLPTFCVGPATADAARAKAWPVEHVAQNADALVQKLITSRPKPPILHIAGSARRGEIAARLTSAGIETQAVAVYDQRLNSLSDAAKTAILRESPVIVPLYSPRTARQFCTEAKSARALHLVCLSDAVREEVKAIGVLSVSVASQPNGRSMLQALQNVLRRVETEHAPK